MISVAIFILVQLSSRIKINGNKEREKGEDLTLKKKNKQIFKSLEKIMHRKSSESFFSAS